MMQIWKVAEALMKCRFKKMKKIKINSTSSRTNNHEQVVVEAVRHARFVM